MIPSSPRVSPPRKIPREPRPEQKTSTFPEIMIKDEYAL
jgi:hypothetical protein